MKKKSPKADTRDFGDNWLINQNTILLNNMNNRNAKCLSLLIGSFQAKTKTQNDLHFTKGQGKEELKCISTSLGNIGIQIRRTKHHNKMSHHRDTFFRMTFSLTLLSNSVAFLLRLFCTLFSAVTFLRTMAPE